MRSDGSGQQAGRLTGEEYLSRFGKEDRIFPVITLIFYYDVKKWDGAVELYDMFRLTDELKKRGSAEKIYSQLSDQSDRCGKYRTFRSVPYGFTTGAWDVKM